MGDQRQALLDAVLERVEADLTAPVMARFYARFPDARASFEHHWPGRAERLEAEMVGNALYYLMTWFERRSEVEIALGTSIPHHHHILNVPVEWYGGMIEAVLEEATAHAPPASAAEAAMWADLRAGLAHAVETSL